MSAAPKDPMAGITAVIKQIKETETVAREENDHVKQLISIQDSLIEKQRKLLVEVAKQSAELLAVEEKRNSLKEQLCSQKTKLLVSASEGSEGSSIIDLEDPCQVSNLQRCCIPSAEHCPIINRDSSP